MPQGKRLTWSDEDDVALIALWGSVGSVALIAIMLRRSRSSVQTRASRLGLPPRQEESDRHRRRWMDGDDAKLDGLLLSLARADGSIPIQQLAESMGRSVDAVVARIEIRHGDESDVMDRLSAPAMPSAPEKPKDVFDLRSFQSGELLPEQVRVTTVKTGSGPRKCLKCRKTFFSDGNFNRICSTCKRSDDWDNDF